MKYLSNLAELVVLIHGIGMLGGAYFIFTNESWLSKVNEALWVKVVVALIWVLAGITLIVSAWAMYKGFAWLNCVSVPAIILNSLAVALWYNGVPGGAIMGAVLADIILVYFTFIK